MFHIVFQFQESHIVFLGVVFLGGPWILAGVATFKILLLEWVLSEVGYCRTPLWKYLLGGFKHVFHNILGIILPTDFHMFQDGYCTTNQICQASLTEISRFRENGLAGFQPVWQRTELLRGKHFSAAQGCCVLLRWDHLPGLVNVYIAMERSTMLWKWENPLFLWPFSIAILVHQRVFANMILWLNHVNMVRQVRKEFEVRTAINFTLEHIGTQQWRFQCICLLGNGTEALQPTINFGWTVEQSC